MVQIEEHHLNLNNNNRPQALIIGVAEVNFLEND